MESIVRSAGHAVSDNPSDTDVVLADGMVSGSGAPVVTLGEAEAFQSGMLPRDASAEQIDAAIRALAAGLLVRSADARRASFKAMSDAEPSLVTPREVEVLAAIGNGSAISRSPANSVSCSTQ